MFDNQDMTMLRDLTLMELARVQEIDGMYSNRAVYLFELSKKLTRAMLKSSQGDETMTSQQRHLREVDIPAWEYGNGDWFTVRLFSLMAHADGGNRHRLGQVFPEELEAFEWWDRGKPGEEK